MDNELKGMVVTTYEQPHGRAGMAESPIPGRLVAVVNSFNRRSLLETSIVSLVSALEQLSMPTAIVVFEAGSTDGSLEWLREYQSAYSGTEIDILVAGPGEDASFSAGVNAGCRHGAMRYPDAKYFFLFETDNSITSGMPIEVAVKLLDSRPDLGAAGFTVTKRSGIPTGFGCSFPSVLQFLMGQQLTAKTGLDKPRLNGEPPFEGFKWGTCDVVYTSPLLVKRTTWEATKGLDAECFPFSDCDLDWCWRAKEMGWKTGVIELTGVVHDNGEQASAWSSSRVITFHRARLRLLQRHHHVGGYLLRLGLLARHVMELVALAVASPILSNPRGSLEKRWRLITSVMQGYVS